MKQQDYWSDFYNSGSVFDYLKYCRNLMNKEQDGIEDHNRRTHNKRK